MNISEFILYFQGVIIFTISQTWWLYLRWTSKFKIEKLLVIVDIQEHKHIYYIKYVQNYVLITQKCTCRIDMYIDIYV